MSNCTLGNYSEKIINPCNGEEIDFNLKIKDCHTEDFARINLMITGNGKGNLGNEYVYSVNLNQNIKNINFIPDEVVKFSIEVKEYIIGKGDAPDFILRIKYHLTVTPNGDTTVDSEILDSKCR